jgi:hypothetical protein
VAANKRKNLLARIVTPGGDDPLLLRLVAPVAIRTGVAATGIALVGQGGAGGYAYSILSGSAYGGLPPGLTLNANGTITGTPTTPGNYAFVAQVQDADSTVYTASFSLRILSRMFRKHKQIRNGEVFIPYTFTLQVGGNTGTVTWSLVSGNLPAGLTLNTSTGVISGDPLSDSNGLGGISYFTIRATDGGSGEYIDLPDRILIYESLEFEAWVIPDIIRGQFYSFTFPITGGASPYTFTLIGNPFTDSKMHFNVSTGELSGVTMLPPDNYIVGIRVRDRFGAVRTVFDVLVVRNANQTIQPQIGGVDVGNSNPSTLNFVDGTGTTAEVTNLGGVVTVKFNSTGGGGGGGVASVGGALPDSSGDVAVTSPDGSVGIGVDSAGALTLTAAGGGGVGSVGGATPDSSGNVGIGSSDASIVATVDSNGDLDLRVNPETRAPMAGFGNGSIILSGTLTIEVPAMKYGGTITGWRIVGDTSGDVSIVVSHATFAAYNTMTTLFTAVCSGQIKESDTGLNHPFAVGDVLRFSASGFAGFTRVAIVLDVA